jgi:hypothetical protein
MTDEAMPGSPSSSIVPVAFLEHRRLLHIAGFAFADCGCSHLERAILYTTAALAHLRRFAGRCPRDIIEGAAFSRRYPLLSVFHQQGMCRPTGSLELKIVKIK